MFVLGATKTNVFGKVFAFGQNVCSNVLESVASIFCLATFSIIKQALLPDRPAIKNLAKHFWNFEKQKLPKSQHFCLYNQNSELFCFLGQNCSKNLQWIDGKATIPRFSPKILLFGQKFKSFAFNC